MLNFVEMRDMPARMPVLVAADLFLRGHVSFKLNLSINHVRCLVSSKMPWGHFHKTDEQELMYKFFLK